MIDNKVYHKLPLKRTSKWTEIIPKFKLVIADCKSNLRNKRLTPRKPTNPNQEFPLHWSGAYKTFRKTGNVAHLALSHMLRYDKFNWKCGQKAKIVFVLHASRFTIAAAAASLIGPVTKFIFIPQVYHKHDTGFSAPI